MGTLSAAQMEGHFVSLYDDDDHLVREVGSYLWRGLDGGGAAVVVAAPQRRAAIAERLAERMHDLGSRLVMLDARATLDEFMVDGMPDEQRFVSIVGEVVRRAGAAGRGRVHAYGEMVALLVQEGRDEAAIRLEQLWNNLGRTQYFSLFCAYPGSAFAGAHRADALRRICHEHAGGVCTAGVP